MVVPQGNGQSPEVHVLWEQGRKILFDALDSLEGEKTIIWDRSVMHRVNLFAGPSVLKTHGVLCNLALDQFHPPETPHVVFFLSPSLNVLDSLCEFIDKAKNDTKILYQVFFIPEAWYVVREKLKERENGRYWERLESVKELALSWLPHDGDCLSLAQPQLPSRLLINGDWTYLHRCAVALNQLISLCSSRIPIYSRGKWSHDIARMVNKMESNIESSSSPASLMLNRIVIIDRWLDPLTPMLTQLTYSGLLDETYTVGIVGSIKVSQAEFDGKDDEDPFQMKEIYLTDEIYDRLKYVHIHAIGQELASVLKEIREDEQIDKDRMSVAEYQILVKKIPQIRRRKALCNTHMRLAEMIGCQLYDVFADQIKVQKELLESSDGDKIVSFIEESIIGACELNDALRMIAVHSLTSNGLKTTVIQQYRRLIMQSYGAKALNRLLKMQKMGLVREKGGSGKMNCEYGPLLFPQMKKQYHLLHDNVSEESRNDAAYVYGGYAPLLIRIIEEGNRLKWAGWNKAGVDGDNGENNTAVFVIGGVTRAELAALKLIPNISMVLTSSMITGNKLLESITKI